MVSSGVGVGRKLPEILDCELWLLVFVCTECDDSDAGTVDIVNFETWKEDLEQLDYLEYQRF